MPTAILPTAQRDRLIDAFTPRLDNGYLRLYDAGNVLLAELRFAADAFPASANATTTANPIAAAGALATGTAATARCYEADGVTLACEGTVGVAGSGAHVILNSTAIQQGADVTVTGVTLSMPGA